LHSIRGEFKGKYNKYIGIKSKSIIDVYSKVKKNPNHIVKTEKYSEIRLSEQGPQKVKNQHSEQIDEAYLVKQLEMPKLYPKQLSTYSNLDEISKFIPSGPSSKKEFQDY